MIQNFDSIKNQLKEVAEIINLFKSEAVQLRIIDRLLPPNGGGDDPADNEQEDQRSDVGGRKPKKPTAKTGAVKSDKAKKPKKSGGPKWAIDKLIADGFFSKPKSIKEIIEHCAHKLAKTYNHGDMSPTLIRAVRGQRLKREHKDDQYVYSAG